MPIFQAQPGEAFAQVPGTNADIDLQRHLAREFAWRTYPQLRHFQLNRDKAKTHPLYRDSADKDRWDDPKTLPILVLHDPSKQRLEKYGIDEQRDLMLWYCVPVLDEVGLTPKTMTEMIGSLVEFDSDLYEIQSQHRAKETYWVNTNVALYIVCTANVHRRGR